MVLAFYNFDILRIGRNKIIYCFLFICFHHVLMAGDDPCSTTSLSLSDAFMVYDNSGNSESGIDAPPYGGYTSPDFWFSFTASSSSLFLFIQPGSMENPALAVYEGPCNDLKLIYNVVDNNCDGSEGPSIEFTDLIAGEEYFIRVWPENGSANGIFSAYFNNVTTVTPEFNAFGDASYSGDCILLTSESNTQNGCAWYEELIDFSQPFTHTMNANFGDKDANGADGICLVYQNVSSSYCGISGGGIGALGMPSSAIFEFDTWQNGIYNDPAQDHCAFNINGDMDHNNSIDGPVTLGNIEDGNDHEIIFTWDPAGDDFELFFDGTSVLSGSYDIRGNCFGGSNTAYWGYTSATGGSNNNHLICPEIVQYDFGTQEYIEELICDGESFQGFDENGFYTEISGGGDCSHQENISLTVTAPTMDLSGPYHIDCYNPEVKLTADIGVETESSLFPIDNIIYEWIAPNGEIETNDCFNTDQGGQFCLTAIISFANTSHTCEIEECIEVTIDTISPQIFTIQDLTIDCNSGGDDDLLDASNSTGNELIFEWFLNNISISNDPFIFTNNYGEGIYSLTLLDQENGCITTGAVEVINDFEIPSILIDPIDTLNCTNDEITLTIEIENWNAEDLDFFWTNPQGQSFDIYENEFDATNPGTYSVTATLPNGCESNLEIEVSQDTIQPNVDVTSSGILDCNNPSVELSAISTDSISSYLWSNNTNSESTTVSTQGIYYLQIQGENGCTNFDSIEVEMEVLNFSFELSDSVLTCSQSSFSFEPIITGDYEMVHWQLANNSTSDQSMIFIDTEGDYILEVIDENGCVITDTMSITLDTIAPSYSFFLDSISCTAQGIITVDTLLATSVSWNINGQTVNDTLQVYSNTVSDAILTLTADNGCQTIDTISFVSNESVPDFTVNSNNINCDNPEANIEVSTVDDLNIFWEGPGNFSSTSEQITTQENGTYFLTVTDDAGCEIFDTLEISIDTITPSLTITAPDIRCYNDETIVSVENPQSYYDYYYLLGNNPIYENSFITNQAVSGTYVAVNPENGCTSEVVFTVNVDTIPSDFEIVYNNINCAFPIAELSIVNPEDSLQYIWNFLNSTFVDSTIQINQGGLGFVESFNVLNGCFDTVYFEILIDTIAPDPQLEIIQMGCDIEEAQLSITNNLGNWNTEWFYENLLIEEDISSFNTSDFGNFSINVIDPENFCATILTANVEEYNPLEAELQIINPSCINPLGSVQILSVTGGIPTYQWSIDNGNTYSQESDFENLAPDNYLLIIQDQENCEIQVPFSIEPYEPLSLEIIDTLFLNPGDIVNVSPVLNIDDSEVAVIEWGPSDILSCTDCWNPNYLITTDTTLSLSITDINGCMASALVHIITPVEVSIYVPNIFSPHNNDGANDFFFPFVSNESIKEVSLMQIYDRWGNRIFSNENFPVNSPEHGWNGRFNDQELNPAVFSYLIKLILNDNEEVLLSGNITLVN